MMLTVEFKQADQKTPAPPRQQGFRLKSSRGLIIGKTEGDEPPWLTAILKEMNELLDLPPNWNSYGAHVIETEAVVRAMQLLGAVTSEASPRPHVVPTRRGGVQLEWHVHDI